MQKICIIIPCYNEEKRLPAKDFSDFVSTSENIYFLFVNDGSKDNTLETLTSLTRSLKERGRTLDIEKNGGKAEAVRMGMIESAKWDDFYTVGYFDADLSTPLSEILVLQKNLNEGNYIMAFGSRFKRMGSKIERNTFRHYTGRVFATFASIILKMDVYDTQCGAKLIKKEILPEIVKAPFSSRWFFDIEIFFRIRNHYGLDYTINNLIEVPLNKWIEKGESKISLAYWFKVPFELLKLYFKYRT